MGAYMHKNAYTRSSTHSRGHAQPVLDQPVLLDRTFTSHSRQRLAMASMPVSSTQASELTQASEFPALGAGPFIWAHHERSRSPRHNLQRWYQVHYRISGERFI